MEMLLPNHCPRASDGDEWCGLSLECVNAWYIWNPWLDLKADAEKNMGRIGMSFPLLYHLLRACHVAVCEAFFRPFVPHFCDPMCPNCYNAKAATACSMVPGIGRTPEDLCDQKSIVASLRSEKVVPNLAEPSSA